MSQTEETVEEGIERMMKIRREEGICDHWTYYGGYGREAVAICDLKEGHEGTHLFVTNVERKETFTWADVYEHHEKRGS